MGKVPLQAKKEIYLGGSEPGETTMLAGKEAPDRATLRGRAVESRA